jgi:uncharacterized protein YggE
MRFARCLLVLLACLIFLGAGQTTYAAAKDTISVSGTAVTDAEPDMAYVTMYLEMKGDTATEVRQGMADKIAALKRVLLGQLIEDKDIKSSGYSFGPRYEYERNKRVQKGFSSSANVVVKVRDLHKLSAVIDKSITQSGASVNNVEFGLQNRNIIEQSLLDDAVTNGRAKAGIVANAGGRTLGNLLSADINNAGGETRVQMPQATLAMMKESVNDAAMAPTLFAPGTITVRTTVYMVFSLL